VGVITSEGMGFLRDLAENNDRDWFKARKKVYDDHVKAPALEFIRSMEGPLTSISSHYLAVPKAVGGSLFRIYRDTRFSKDKSPYKTHTGVQFRHELMSKDVHAPGFYLQVSPGGSGVGVGVWAPGNPALAKIRQWIDENQAEWGELLQELRSLGFDFMHSDTDLKRVPRGYDPDHPYADDLRRKTIAVHRPVSDDDVLGDAVAAVSKSFEESAPLVRVLCQAFELPF